MPVITHALYKIYEHFIQYPIRITYYSTKQSNECRNQTN